MADNWNKFDFLLVTLACTTRLSSLANVALLPDTSVARLLRVLRVVRTLNKMPQLRATFAALLGAVSSVATVMLLMQYLNFLFAAIGMVLFRKNDPENFGTIPEALMSSQCNRSMGASLRVCHLSPRR